MADRISLAQYFGPYNLHADINHERLNNAVALVAAANTALALAEADGVALKVNPATKCLIAGSGNGGFRPQDCPIGAPRSSHKTGQGIDIYDPDRAIAAWSLRNEARLRELGIVAIEDPRWTPTWCHWQTRDVPGKFSFIPDSSAPKVAALPEQTLRGIA